MTERERGCDTKKSYHNYREAERVKGLTIRMGDEPASGKRLRVYRCRYCQEYHIGHSSGKPN